MKRLFFISLFVTIVNLVYSQDPQDISSLLFWYDSENVEVINNSVSSFIDLSGINNLTQSNASRRPIYASDVFNGFPAVIFGTTPSQNNMIAANSSDPGTVALVIKVNQYTSYGNLFDRGGAFDSGVAIRSNGLEIRASDDPSKRAIFQSPTFDYLMIVIREKIGGNTFPIRVNGFNTAVSMDGEFLPGNYQLGRSTASGIFELYAFLSFDTVITEDEVIQVESYLQNKYARQIELDAVTYLSPSDNCSTQLTAPAGFSNYIWNNSSSGQDFITTELGFQSVRADTDLGMTTTDSTLITFYYDQFPESIDVCEDDSIEFQLQTQEGFNIIWSTSEIGNSIFLEPLSIYWADISDDVGCVLRTDSIFTLVDEYGSSVGISGMSPFCLGNELFLTSGFAEAETYL